MTTKAPASAALLAQAVGDVAPFLGSSNRPTPSLELTEDQAMLAAPTSPSDTTNAGTGDGVQLTLPSTSESWTELAVGPLGSTRRLVSFHLTALVISTLVRSAAFSPKLGFGNYLLENLAPVERDGVRWAWILALRAAEIVIGARVWRRVRGAAKHDGALFGFMLALVSRVPLYTFEHSYFLLSTQTVGVLLLIDTLTFGAAFSLLPRLLPHPPAPRPTLSVFDRLAADPNQYLNILFALGLATTTTALGSFVLERFGGRKFIEHNVFEAVVPSYLMRDQLTTSEVLAHPSWTIPALRTYDAAEHLSMHAHLVHSLGSNLPLLPLALAIPSALLGPQRLALLIFALVGLPSAFILWDVLPLTTIGAFSTGIALGIRQAWSAFVIAWTLESLRRTKSVKNVKIVVYDQQVGVAGEEVADVIATTVDAKLITDASEQGMATASAVGATRTSPRRKAVLKGEVEL